MLTLQDLLSQLSSYATTLAFNPERLSTFLHRLKAQQPVKQLLADVFFASQFPGQGYSRQDRVEIGNFLLLVANLPKDKFQVFEAFQAVALITLRLEKLLVDDSFSHYLVSVFG